MVATVGAAPSALPEPDLDDVFDDPRPFTVPMATGPATQQVVEGPCRFCGLAFIETGGAGAATFELYDGMDVNAQLLYVQKLQAGGSSPTSFSYEGIDLRSGLLFNLISGQCRGVIWVRVRLPA